MNVKIAFLHGHLPEEVFLKQPPCFDLEDYSDHVYKLDKEVSDLKQLPGEWYDTFFYLLG